LKAKVDELNEVLLSMDSVEERKMYLEGLGALYRELRASEEVYIDTRDYTLYSLLKVGDYYWMRENLRYDSGDGSYVYDGNSEYLKEYGRLYTQKAAEAACPEGWHLPDNKAWQELLLSAGGYYDAFRCKHVGDAPEVAQGKLEKGGSSGFDAVYGGDFYRSFTDLENYGFYWSGSTGAHPRDRTFVCFHRGSEDVCTNESDNRFLAYSVRCVLTARAKDKVKALNHKLFQMGSAEERIQYLEGLGKEFEELKGTKEVFLDRRDGTLYSVVKIGEQYWLGENIRYDVGVGCHAWQRNEANVPRLGRLYDTFVMEEACPEGCRIPSFDEWKCVLEAVGVEFDDAEEFKDPEAYTPLAEGERSGLDLVCGGLKPLDKESFESQEYGYYFMSTHGMDTDLPMYFAFQWLHGAFFGELQSYERCAMSVRCLVDVNCLL